MFFAAKAGPWVCGTLTILIMLLGVHQGRAFEIPRWCLPDFQCHEGGKTIQHTLCEYGAIPAPDTRCRNFKSIQSDVRRRIIVDAHNAARLEVSRGALGDFPSAANMREISYDRELETIAYRWAEQCIAGHDKCRRTREWPHVGQIVSETSSNESIDVETVGPRNDVRKWLLEHEAMKPTPKSLEAYVPNEKAARFTQLIWADTYKVGCADVIYETDDVERYHRKLVCNYGPGGNVAGAQIYSAGPICSECATGVKCLCGGVIPLHEDTTMDASAAPTGDAAAGSYMPATGFAFQNPLAARTNPDKKFESQLALAKQFAFEKDDAPPADAPAADAAATTTVKPAAGGGAAPPKGKNETSTKAGCAHGPSGLAIAALCIYQLSQQ